ncbi:MAG: molybdopterin-dependent oxidoreductase, partial [Dehalococcoidia bacterium]
LIVVDPRKIELTALAHQHLRLNVGSDIALFNAMAHVIIRERLYDEEYVRGRVDGFEELAEHLAAYPPERAAEITGVPAEEIAAAARAYAGAERAAICYTLGVTEHSCGVHNVQSLANLALLCGNFGIENAGVNPLRGQNNVQGAGDVGCLPADLPGYQKVHSDDVRRRYEEAWGVQIPERPGITKVRAIDEILNGSVRGVYIMGENTVVSDANANRTRQALEALEFLVVQDIFLTETAKLADVVLPAAAFAEIDGTYTNTERRVQRVRKAVDPPGEARPDADIICDLATRLGYPMSYSGPAEIWEEIARNTPILAGISYERLEKEGGLQWPCPSPDHPGTKFLHEDLFVTGRGQLAAVDHMPPAEPTNDEYPLLLTTGRRRPLYHTNTQTARAPGILEISPHEYAEMNPQDATHLGLSEGDSVQVISRRGRVTTRARVTDVSPPGVVFMSFHFPWETATNELTTDISDPITETPEFKACAVRIERLPGGRPEGREP